MTEIFGAGPARDVVVRHRRIAGHAMVPRLLENLRFGADRTHAPGA